MSEFFNILIYLKFKIQLINTPYHLFTNGDAHVIKMTTERIEFKNANTEFISKYHADVAMLSVIAIQWSMLQS